MFYLDLAQILLPQKKKEEKRILKKAKEKGIESLTEEEKIIYQEVIRRSFLA